MAQIIKTDGTIETINKNKLTLSFMQETVGGYIEIVPLGKKLLVCNEEGKLKNLPLNEKATQIWEAVYGKTDQIVGNIILAKQGEIE
jgi:hypothetical protein